MKRIILCLMAFIAAGLVYATDLSKAISDGDLGKVKALLNENPGIINTKDDHGLTPLNLAITEGKKDIVLELINRGADVKICDDENAAPIHNAAMIGSIEIFELIRSKGVELDTRDSDGLTPLFYSIRAKQPEMSKYLIDKGANVKAVTTTKWPLLLFAAIYGQTETAKLLIAKKADVNAKSEEGYVPLHSAVSFGRTEIVKLLVDNGAKLNETNNHGETPLFWARNTNTYDAAKYLIEKGADVNHRNSIGGTILMSVAGRGSINVAELFLQHGVPINAIDSNGGTALSVAAFSRNPDAMSKFLIMNGADVNPVACTHGKACSCNPNHSTPLHRAAMMGLLDMSRNLVSNGARINVYDQQGYTPLMLAVKKGNLELVKYLVENGAFLNQKDKNLGYTELLLASALGYKELVSYLLQKGSDVSIATNDGQSALDLAWYYGHKDIAFLLLSNGASDAKLKELVAQPALITQQVSEKEANIWFLGHGSWAIKTKNHFMIFDYATNPSEKAPADSSLASGYILPKELKGEKVTVFATHSHGDHYNKNIFKWKEVIPDINYVLCFNPPDATGDYTYIPIHGEKTVDGIKISTIRSTDLDGGYLIEVDGLVIFEPGDHTNGQNDLMKAFTDEIDWVAAKGLKIDIAFSAIRGCSLGQPPQVKLGVNYMLDKLQPNLFIPMHAGSTTEAYKLFADEITAVKPNQKVKAVVNKGDHFSYKN